MHIFLSSEINFIKGFALAKLFSEIFQLPFLLNQSYKEGYNFFFQNDSQIVSISNINLKDASKIDFENYCKEQIDKELKYYFKYYVSLFNNFFSFNKLEVNGRNKTRKKFISYLEQFYINLYYIYNNKVYQIIKITNIPYSKNIIVTVEKPSGKAKDIIFNIEEFKNKKFFFRKNIALSNIFYFFILITFNLN